VRWSIGGSRAATGNGEAHADMSGQSVDAAQIQALLNDLSRVRLAVSADLSAAAGALDDNRPDVASDVLSGARRELAELRSAHRLLHAEPSLAPPPRTVGASGADVAEDTIDPVPAVPSVRGGRSRLARALAGAAALAVAIAVVPQVAGGSSHPSTGTTSAERAPAIHLASSEFSLLSQRLTAAGETPAAIVAAERSWQSALSRDLPAAATQAAGASAVVSMLREERTLIAVSPTLRAPQNRALATTLAAGTENLLAQLRGLADPHVLAILPTVIGTLPLSNADKPALPPTGATPSPVASATPGPSSTSTQSPSSPATGTTSPATPAPSSGTLPLPGLGNGQPVTPVPLPSTLGQLTGGGESGGLGQTVGSVLNGLNGLNGLSGLGLGG
jgi:hypothetical protein